MASKAFPVLPIDLLTVAQRLAAATGQPPETRFAEAHRLLTVAREYLATHIVEPRIFRLYQGQNERLSFSQATAPGGPLRQLWKGRQGVEQAIKRLRKKGLIKPMIAAKWLKEGALSELDVSLLLRSLKLERCGALDEGDGQRTNAELCATIPPRPKTRSRK
jgi:hypothetical protein